CPPARRSAVGCDATCTTGWDPRSPGYPWGSARVCDSSTVPAPASRRTRPAPLLTRLADEVDGVVHEIKRIVRGLRPTALDQLGLVGAVAEFTRKLDGDLEIHLSL